MGVIKDGKIYGNLPSEEVFAVHYPAYTSSIERAIVTLGGTQAISKALASDTNKLELRFRPEDPYSHPAFGEFQPSNNFLLRVSKINTQKDEARNGVSIELSSAKFENLEKQKPVTDSTQNCDELNQTQTELVADIIACVPKAYHFYRMADFQHIPAIHADVARKKKENYAEFENGGFMDVDQDDFVTLVPPLFSLKDLPTNVVLSSSASLNNLKRKQDGLADRYWEWDIEPSLALDFYIKEIPKKVNWEKHLPSDSKQWKQQKAVCELFDERPIWVKGSISERLLEKGLNFTGTMLRKLLFRVAYYFSNGPFLRYWIRKGYDPRNDPESRIYQRTDFRVPPELRSYCDVTDAPLESGSKRWRDMCNFKVFPTKCFTSFQLFDLADDYIQEEIRKPPTRTTCSCATGWFSSTAVDTFRLCVKVRFLSVYPNGSTDSLLKQASRRFEKSKRLCLFPKELQQSEGQDANTEIIGNEDNEPNNSDEDDNVEDEIEEDNVEDEIEDDNIEDDLDAYEALDLDGNFSPRQHSESNDENLSRNFLQELFVNFPDSNGIDDNEPNHANESDGEYHIYEHSSDYSDDND